ncbi:MAG TPA: hypothetical protein VG675_07970 [Bryobacteraceae bacterium]|nr:hypothetical protein [Bryobacteraceae bacterium]
MRLWAICLLAAASLLAGCNSSAYPYPYRKQGNPQGQNPKGSPADRTGGSRNVPDGVGGGGPHGTTAPADQPR